MWLNTVLCPVSLLPSSLALLKYAACLALSQRARLRILHVIDPDRSGAPPTISATGAGRLEAARRLAEARYAESVPAGVRAATQHEVSVVEGDVAERVAAAAEDHNVDLVVMGFQPSEQPCAHMLDRVLKHIRKPVLAVPHTAPTASPSWRHILLATDLAAESATTHAAAVALADAAGATLMVVHVIEDRAPAPVVPESFSAPPLRDIALQEAADQLDSAFHALPCGLPEMVICGGDLSSEIARVAQREAADLLVVGFRPSSHHLMGTAAGRLLNRIGCPVLSVPHATRYQVPGEPLAKFSGP